MKPVAFSDIRGNTVALDAVLDDIRRWGSVGDYWVLGDLATSWRALRKLDTTASDHLYLAQTCLVERADGLMLHATRRAGGLGT